MYLEVLYEKLQKNEALSRAQLDVLETEFTAARDILRRLGPVFKLAAQELEYRVLHIQSEKEKIKLTL